MLLEAIKAEDEDGGHSVKLDLFHGVLMLFAAATVPTVLRTEALSQSELLKTAFNRLLLLLHVLACSLLSGMVREISQLINLLNLLLSLKVFSQEKHFELNSIKF